MRALCASGNTSLGPRSTSTSLPPQTPKDTGRARKDPVGGPTGGGRATVLNVEMVLSQRKDFISC